MKRALFLLTLIMTTTACEYVPIPGGKLQGELMAVPADWQEIASVEIVQLETNSTEPYSVNLWFLGEGKNIYVHAGTNRAQWVENIEQDPEVKLLVEGKLYELQARRVVSADEFKIFADLWELKYGSRPGNENVDEAYLYLLAPGS
jgi:hypothetical protein